MKSAVVGYGPVILILYVVSSTFAGMKNLSGDSLPIIYSPRYNISILGMENFHPFDSKKYAKVYKGLRADRQLCRCQFYEPLEVPDEHLLSVHTPRYLESLKKSRVIAEIVEIPPFRLLPNALLRHCVLGPMRAAAGGTILGVRLALRYGWAINLSGGYHHAKSDRGEGFCVYADVPIALHSLWKEMPDLKVLIVDLDAHQGNGNSTILGSDPRVGILDMFNDYIFPNDNEAETFLKYCVPLSRRANTAQYLDSLKKWLPSAIENHQPDLIIYNAGTDIYLEDPMGNLSITEQGIIDRDEYVFSQARSNSIPILMVLSGGYHKKSGYIIAKSIRNLMVSENLINASRNVGK
jgi:histone deacetylase 11